MNSMREKTGLIILMGILMLAGFSTKAQEKLMPVMPVEDSTQLLLEKQILYQQLTSGKLENSQIFEVPQLPKFDFSAAVANRINIEPSERIHATTFNGFMPEMFTVFPLFHNGAIFSSATYQLSDKFSVGGYSFGANSIFSAPLPNQGMNNFDTHGSTMFMQYKVSKNFKIETRVSVTQGPGGF